MSTLRATTQLIKAKERIEAKIEEIKSKTEKKIIECEDELENIDKALNMLSAGDSRMIIPVKALAI